MRMIVSVGGGYANTHFLKYGMPTDAGGCVVIEGDRKGDARVDLDHAEWAIHLALVLRLGAEQMVSTYAIDAPAPEDATAEPTDPSAGPGPSSFSIREGQ